MTVYMKGKQMSINKYPCSFASLTRDVKFNVLSNGTDDEKKIHRWHLEFLKEYRKSLWIDANTLQNLRTDWAMFQDNTVYFEIEKNGKAIGYFRIRDWSECSLHEENPIRFISEIYILPEYRAHGIYSLAIKLLCRNADVHAVLLSRKDRQRYKKFYRSFGFTNSVSFRAGLTLLCDKEAFKVSKRLAECHDEYLDAA